MHRIAHTASGNLLAFLDIPFRYSLFSLFSISIFQSPDCQIVLVWLSLNVAFSDMTTFSLFFHPNEGDDIIAEPYTSLILAESHTLLILAESHTLLILAESHTSLILAESHTLLILAESHTLLILAESHTSLILAESYT
jgi:hypothetical protein